MIHCSVELQQGSVSPSMKSSAWANPLWAPPCNQVWARPMPGVPSLAWPAAPPLSSYTTAPTAQGRSKAVLIWARIHSEIKLPKHQTCCWGAFSTLASLTAQMKQRYGWLQLIPCYHASGLWICNEAREAACSDMNQAELLGMVSLVSGPSTRGAVELLKSSQKQCKKRRKKIIICLYLNNEMRHFSLPCFSVSKIGRGVLSFTTRYDKWMYQQVLTVTLYSLS